MPISAPGEQDVPTHLSAKLRNLPALIEAYLLLVDQVMHRHGFDQDKGAFLVEQALPTIDSCNDNLTQIPPAWGSHTPELSPLVAA